MNREQVDGEIIPSKLFENNEQNNVTLYYDRCRTIIYAPPSRMVVTIICVSIPLK